MILEWLRVLVKSRDDLPLDTPSAWPRLRRILRVLMLAERRLRWGWGAAGDWKCWRGECQRHHKQDGGVSRGESWLWQQVRKPWGLWSTEGGERGCGSPAAPGGEQVEEVGKLGWEVSAFINTSVGTPASM